ncbi:MAG: hypothetical protein AAGF94_18680 [Pseudomonadota bacterium]
MKKALIFAVASMVPLAANARDTVIALSPDQLQAALETQLEQVMTHLLDSLQPGDTALFLDGTEVERIALFAMPSGPQPIPANRALQANRKALANLGRFIRRSEAETGEGQIDLPGLLRHVRAHVPAPDGADLIVLGHPIFAPDETPRYSMASHRVPSDGHISAGPDRSPFGTANLPGTLAGYDVYFGHLANDWAITPGHRYGLERFWSLSVEAHGGSMAYQGADLATLFALAGDDAPNRAHAEPLKPNTPLEMVVYGPEAERARAAQTTETVVVNGVAVDSFSLFAKAPHPSLPGVQVTTGIRYAPADYPHRYISAWCYVDRNLDGDRVIVDLGKKAWGGRVTTFPAKASAGMTMAQVRSAKESCQWPTP